MIGKRGEKKKNEKEEKKGKNRRGRIRRRMKKKKEEKEAEEEKHSKCLSLHIRVLSPQTKPCDNHETGLVFALLSNGDFSTLVEPLFQSLPD